MYDCYLVFPTQHTKYEVLHNVDGRVTENRILYDTRHAAQNALRELAEDYAIPVDDLYVQPQLV